MRLQPDLPFCSVFLLTCGSYLSHSLAKQLEGLLSQGQTALVRVHQRRQLLVACTAKDGKSGEALACS